MFTPRNSFGSILYGRHCILSKGITISFMAADWALRPTSHSFKGRLFFNSFMEDSVYVFPFDNLSQSVIVDHVTLGFSLNVMANIARCVTAIKNTVKTIWNTLLEFTLSYRKKIVIFLCASYRRVGISFAIEFEALKVDDSNEACQTIFDVIELYKFLSNVSIWCFLFYGLTM